jgi:hypothetical protein
MRVVLYVQNQYARSSCNLLGLLVVFTVLGTFSACITDIGGAGGGDPALRLETTRSPLRPRAILEVGPAPTAIVKLTAN